MILIVVKFKSKPDWSERWLDLVDDFTRATRAEPGNLWFQWSRSVRTRPSSSSLRRSRTTLRGPTSAAITSNKR